MTGGWDEWVYMVMLLAALAVGASARTALRGHRQGSHSRGDDEPIFRLPPHPANVPGPFYVEDGCCLSCGVWEDVAPDLLSWFPEDGLVQCYVSRQPETDAEFGRMMEAMKVNEVDCIRVHGCSPDWAKRLRENGLGAQIDPPTGPLEHRV